MSQAQLALAMFPLGDFCKDETREMARRLGLPNADKPESQEICFIPDGDYRSFLRETAPDIHRPGEIRDLTGRVLGEHAGVPGFTVGQRRGLDLPGKRPRYVVRLESETATVVVGGKELLARDSFRVENIRWSLPAPPEGARLLVQVRHRQRPRPCRLIPLSRHLTEVLPDDPESLGAVAPGQAAVFYEGALLYGGGWVAG